jgi:hypothetical protein
VFREGTLRILRKQQKEKKPKAALKGDHSMRMLFFDLLQGNKFADPIYYNVHFMRHSKRPPLDSSVSSYSLISILTLPLGVRTDNCVIVTHSPLK